MLKKTYFLINLLVIFHTSHRVRAKFDHWCNYDMKPSGKCGVHLDELLEGTCGEGNFNSPDNSIYAIYGMPTMLGGRNQLTDILMGKRDANVYLKKRREYSYQGIVCECCINQCSIMELRTYCLVPNWTNLIY